MGVHLAEAFEAADVDLGVGVVLTQLGAYAVALAVVVGHARRLAPRELVERGHRGVDIAVLDERAHIAEEEGQQQRPDVAAVDIGIGHDDYLVVTQLCEVEVLAQSGAEGGYDGVEFVVAVYLLLADLLDVEHLAPEREYGLEAAVAAAGGGAACAVALDDVELGEGRVALVAVSQFAGEGGALEGVLAADVLSRPPRGLAGLGGGHRLVEDGAAHGGVLLEELLELVAHHAVHQRAHVGVAELCLCLALELRVRQLDGDDGGQALAAVVAGDALALLEDVRLAAVGVEHAGERGLEAGLVHAALRRVDVVGEGDEDLVVAVVVLHGYLALGVLAGAGHIDDVVVQRGLVAVYETHELADAARVVHDVLLLLALAPVLSADAQTGVEEGLLPHAGVERVIIEHRVLEHLGVRVEADHGAGVVGLADDGHRLRDVAAGELHLIDLPVLVDADLQPVGERVDDAGADAVQAAGDLVAPAAELAARVQHGVDDLERGLSRLLLYIDGYAAAVIRDADDVPRLYDDLDIVAVARQRFVDGVVHDLVHEVVQTGGRGRAYIHAGPEPDGL